ncbi:MATE family efflux transporter [Jeotgalibaca sp. MA1X17-3]|uniref:MATE family efflux transporter n=1 Tax=Jeotgalibaca sp. MA1X17-3 TaxID=2908211 RepID=UPI001F4553A9|nr:MATE family efflux transporter [Jeotgalibaca sp. MA1X17-3]UJF15437.1 MATE family efflux transporter [Jeotgalibaca sp. MA1X17-3]
MDKFKKPQENKMGTMPINRLLISMSVPMMISMLVQALYNIVDSIFVAQIDEKALTGVSLAFPVQSLMIAIAVGSGVGINALVSRRLGEKRFEEANQTAENGIFLNMLHYLLFAGLAILFMKQFFLSQTNDPEIIRHGQEYLYVISFFGLGKFLQITFERLLQSTGLSFYSMISQGAGAVINIIMDPILIFGLLGLPAMGTKGAAIATVIGQSIAASLGLYFNLKYNKELQFSLKKFQPRLQILKDIYAIGIPSILMMSLASFLNLAMNNILIAFTPTATAVFGIYFRLQSFVFMPIFGMNNGMVPIIGYNYGARKADRIKEVLRLGVKYALSIMFIGTILFQLFPEQLLSMFNASPEMLKIGIPAMRIISTHFIMAGFTIVMSSSFQAFGLGKYSLIISLIRQVIVLLPVAYFMAQTGDLNLVWWAYPISEAVSVIVCLFFLRVVTKNIINRLDDSDGHQGEKRKMKESNQQVIKAEK